MTASKNEFANISMHAFSLENKSRPAFARRPFPGVLPQIRNNLKVIKCLNFDCIEYPGIKSQVIHITLPEAFNNICTRKC